MTDPLTDPGASADEIAFEGALRPTSLAEFVGQPKVKGQLEVLLQAARLQDRAVGSSRVDLQACKLEYSIVSPK